VVLTHPVALSIEQPAAAPTEAVVRATGSGVTGSVADEAAVIDIWSTVLARPIQRDDNFFEVGGHSLLAVKVFRLLGERVDVPLALTDIFRFPNARLLGAHIAALRGEPGPANGLRSGTASAGQVPATPSGDDRGARRRNALLGRGRNS
jgi:hypothetical protein